MAAACVLNAGHVEQRLNSPVFALAAVKSEKYDVRFRDLLHAREIRKEGSFRNPGQGFERGRRSADGSARECFLPGGVDHTTSRIERRDFVSLRAESLHDADP